MSVLKFQALTLRLPKDRRIATGRDGQRDEEPEKYFGETNFKKGGLKSGRAGYSSTCPRNYSS